MHAAGGVARSYVRSYDGPLAFVLVGLIALTVSVAVGLQPVAVASALGLVVLLAVGHERLLAWQSLLALMIVIILFVPMRRYTLPGSLPFELDLFRLVTAIVLFGWIASLLADPRVGLRRSGLEGPVALVLAATVGSVVFNADRVTAAGREVAKDLTFLLSYFVIFFLIVSVVVRHEQIDRLIKVLVGSGALVAAAAIVETRTHSNIFDHLTLVAPFLQEQPLDPSAMDMRGFRAFGSAQHPIALSAALVLLLPLSIYLIQRTGQRRWWVPTALLFTGGLATMSRTSVIMLVVIGIVFLRLRPREVKRLLPALVPVLVVVHVAVPGTLGTLKQSFFPSGGLVAQQQANAGYSGQGRLADIGPALEAWEQNPLLGTGFGTRILGAAGIDGQILDDQWLGTLLETGILGVLGWLWLLSRAGRRFARVARGDPSPRAWLMTALTASTAAFGFGMIFFDAFAFVQVTLLFFMVIAFGSALLAREDQLAALG